MTEPATAPSAAPNVTTVAAPGGDSGSSGENTSAAGGFAEPIEASGASWAAKHFAALAAKESGSGKPKPAAKAPESPGVDESGAKGVDPAAAKPDEVATKQSQDSELEVTPEAALALVDTLKAAAKEGNFDEILKALGINPEGMKVPSSRFAELRKQQKAMKEQSAAERRAVASEREQIRTEVGRFIEEHKPFAEAMDHFKRGDLVRAMETAFGVPFDKLQERALEQKLAASPEGVMAMTRLEQMEKERKTEAERKQRDEATARETAEIAKYCKDLGEELKASATDPIVRKAATRPDFPAAVYRAQRHAYQTSGELLTSEEAASRVLEVVRKAHADWADVFGTARAESANSDQTATQSENTERAGIAPESQQARRSGVRQKAPLAPPAPKSDAESLAFWKRQMEAANAKERASRR